MDTVFLLCAIIGGTIMVLQLAMILFGVGGHHTFTGDGNLGGDLGGAAAGHHFGGDLGGAHAAGSSDFAGHDAAVGSHHAAGPSHSHDSAASQEDSAHGSSWIFQVITLQTVVAAIAFFGIAGKAALAAQVQTGTALIIAAGAGVAAMYGVFSLVRLLNDFNADGTLQMASAIGKPATVYVPIPGGNAGAGKIHLNLQNRFLELDAKTAEERLPSGAQVKVVALLGPETVAVERLIEAEIPSHV
jgi:hypothetical protein